MSAVKVPSGWELIPPGKEFCLGDRFWASGIAKWHDLDPFHDGKRIRSYDIVIRRKRTRPSGGRGRK